MGTCLVQSVSQDHQETRAASPQEARWSSNVPDSGDRRWMSLPPSSEVQKIGKTFKCFASFFLQNLGFFLQMQMLSISQQSFSDGSHWFDLRRDGFAGGQRFRFTPKVEDYSRRTQVKF